MVFDLSLFDLINPYVLRGDSFGAWHAALSTMLVRDYEVAADENGTVIRGVVVFKGNVHPPTIDPQNMSISFAADNTEGHPHNEPGRRDPWIDIRDSKIDFQLTVPREASQKVATAVSNIGANAAFDPVAKVLDGYDDTPLDPPPSDFPNTAFTLDFVLTALVLRPPFLRGAKREANGQLVPDLEHEEVEFNLPRIKMRLQQGSGNNDPLTADLLSLGASGLDDPGDIAVAELISMNPPYAFIGPADVIGFGFRSGVLDLSDGSTPPDVLSQFGFDESWKGLYLPEIRLFVAPNGAQDLAVEGGANNLLIGFGDSAGVTGDFNLTMLNQGAGPLKLGARFYDADGRSYGLTYQDDNTAVVQLPEKTRMVIDVEGGLVPYNTTMALDGGAAQAGQVFEIDLSGQTRREIAINVTDSSATPKTGSLLIKAARRSTPALPPPGTAPTAQNPPATIQTTSISQGGTAVQSPRLKLVAETATSATIALDVGPAKQAQTSWQIDSVAQGAPSATVTVPLAPGTEVSVRAELPDMPAMPGNNKFTAYYRFDHPKPPQPATNVEETRSYALQTNNTRTEPATDEGTSSNWQGGTEVKSALRPLLEALPPGTAIDIKGYASFEQNPSPSKRNYNDKLAARRAFGLCAIIKDLETEPALAGKNFDITDASDMSNWKLQGHPDVSTRRIWWKAVATWPAVAINEPGTITQGVVKREPVSQPPGTPPEPKDPPAASPPQPPSWFHTLGCKVRIVRNSFVACEIFGRFDVQTAAENRLQGHLGGGSPPQGEVLNSDNPADGLIDVRLVIQIDDANDTVSVIAYFGADPADLDGLYKWGTLPGQPVNPNPPFGLNFMGTAIVLMPLLSAGAETVANDGALAELAVTGAMLGIPALIAGTGFVKIERVIWYGGEVALRIRPHGTEVTFLFDIETALSMAIEIGGKRLIEIARDAPLAVRYKAVGIRAGYEPGETAFQFRPIFDASKGYTIDVSRPGAIKVAEPLDDILQILGARVARNNPFLFEVDLGFAVDLGVISIERARVRIEFVKPQPVVELTAFAAGVDIPGALRGRGFLELNTEGVKGQLDLTLVPLHLRINAGVGVENIPAADGGPATAVIVTLDVSFPVAIPLGSSGLGIYGFLGLFAMHYSRDESKIDPQEMAPALAWLKAAKGEVNNLFFWKPEVDTWAFGVGALVGTMGTSVIFNMKGVVLLELPGPRLLLMMKANLLQVMPELENDSEGLFLAVIDLDLGRGTMTIGLSIDYKVTPLIEIQIPVEAFFNFNEAKDWHIYLGRYQQQVRATILEIFEGTGYLMLSGSGISGIPNLREATGFAIATGLHVCFLWGSRSAGLYVEVAAGFDALVGFDPFQLSGIMYLRGSLRLFIVTIGAHAQLKVEVGQDGAGDKIARISGEVCGRVEFFFFDVEGCVNFALGASNVGVPAPPPLARSLKLVSRTPALVAGSGVDKPIDGGVADGVEGGAAPPANLPVVPIDIIPVIMMSAPPIETPGLTFKGMPLKNSSQAPLEGWVQHGDFDFKYELKAVDLIGPLTAGSTPATWWQQKSGDTALAAQLALLDWLPEPTPKAIERSKFLTELVKESWGTVCWPAARETAVLWTFLNEVLGPSPKGWDLQGEAWPDAPGTVRSKPADVDLHVDERWRSGNQMLDLIIGVTPAEVEGALVFCPQVDDAEEPAEPGFVDVIGAARGYKHVESLSSERISISEALRRMRSGVPVSRAQLAGAVPSSQPSATLFDVPPEEACASRMLAAPMMDSREPRPFGGEQRMEKLKVGWDKAGFQPGPFDDAVVFHCGPVLYAVFYLMVPERILAGKMLVAAIFDKDDNMIEQRIVTSADLMPPQQFPPTWTDPDGPWFAEIQILSQHQALLEELGYSAVLLTLEGKLDGHTIQLGLLPMDPEFHRAFTFRPFYVAAAEMLRWDETLRRRWDQSEQGKKQGVLETVFGTGSTEHALLRKGQTYGVQIKWDVSRRAAGEAAGTPVAADQTQTFWFKTDEEAPKRLDPWMMGSTPADGETHYFGKEELRIIFGTPNVADIFEVYNRELQVRIKAASFRPTPSSATVPHPFPIHAATLKDVPAGVLSPWEAEMEALLEGSCIPMSGERTRHGMVIMPIPLEPFTDYIMDIESVPKDGNGTVELVYRRSFSTGGFATIAEFAQSFTIARIQHRFAATGKLQAISGQFSGRDPQGAELDNELIKAGFEPFGVAQSPQTIVFWETGGPEPAPVALMLDASEPMWRSRPMAKIVADPDEPGSKHHEMVSSPWLVLQEQTGGDAIVERIIPAPGGARALLILKPGSRGKTIRLALVRIAHKEPYLDGAGAVDQYFNVLDLQLIRAPWEEND